jgi:hypothetical protein
MKIMIAIYGVILFSIVGCCIDYYLRALAEYWLVLRQAIRRTLLSSPNHTYSIFSDFL